MPSKKTEREQRKSAEASMRAANDLDQPIEDHEGFAIRDFVYHDARRIASFLAQFHEYGLRNQIKATETYGRVTSSKTIVGASASIPALAQGKADWDVTNTEDERDTTESIYGGFQR